MFTESTPKVDPASQASTAGPFQPTAALVARLLGMLRDLAVTYWAHAAFDVAALVLADRDPEAAAVALCASRPIDDGDGRLVAMRERLRRCRARLGPGTAQSPDEAIARTLAALGARP